MAGYSSTPLVKKLGIKSGVAMKVVNEPEGYWDWLSTLPENVSVNYKTKELDFIHWFVRRGRHLKMNSKRKINVE